MLVTQCNVFSYLVVKKNGTIFGSTGIVAQKRELGENSGKLKKEANFPFRVSISSTILAQSAVAVFGLGFIDAGYSGDWSRIGAISKESEDLLKLAAFVVVPLCLFLIVSFSKKHEN
ncbi:uncharacterized protein LOC130752568 [Actinidia eriantha]|uniref:uncharacterized protein LOC130752568 n=1 Tax=Actinidia eriantha TaxID=165200 RepID=UPI0025830ED5|nr:uncharacterized protein LOC130752568 [Actinidia eriantha]